MTRGVFMAAVCVWLVWPQSAQANIAASRRAPAELGGPDALARTPLLVVREALSFDCIGAEVGLTCTFDAHYEVYNPTEGAESVSAAFYGVRASGIEILVDGEAASGGVSETELEALDARVAEAETGESPIEGQVRVEDRAVSRWGFVMEVGAQKVRAVDVSGTIEPGHFFKPAGFLRRAPLARHRLLGGDPRAQSWGIEYLLAPIRTWASVGPIEVRVRWPASWRLRGGLVGPKQPPRAGDETPWVRRDEGDVSIASVTLNAEAGVRLYLSFTDPASAFAHGGPLVGLGAALGEGGGVRLRVGWEVAAPTWLLYELSADFDLDSRLVVSPTLKAASPQVYIIPSLAFGLGAPVRIRPELEPGVRAQVDVHFTALAFVASFELFPGLARSDPDFFEATLFGQVSF